MSNRVAVPRLVPCSIKAGGEKFFSSYSMLKAFFAFVLVSSMQLAQADPSLVASWPLDEGTGTNVSDASGNGNNGTIFNGASWSGNELQFDGANDYVDVGNMNVSGSALTITGRFRADNFANCGSSDCRIISKATGVGTQDHFFMVSTIKKNGNLRLRFRLKLNGTTSTLIASSGNLPTNTWVQFAAVYDGAKMKIYKDGSQVGSVAKTGSITTNNSASVWIGGNPPNGTDRPWDGSVADVKIYNRALSAAEIGGSGGSNTVPTFASTPVKTAVEGSNYLYNVSASDPDAGDALTIEATKKPAWMSFSSSGSSAQLSGTPGSSDVGSQQVVLNVTDLQNAKSTQSFYVKVDAASSGGGGGLVGSWPLDDGSGSIARDVSGNANNGNLVNGPKWSGNELKFDGANDYVNLGPLNVAGSAMTVTAWFKAEDLQNCSARDCRLISKATGTNLEDHDWMLSTIKAANGSTRLRFRLKAGGSTKNFTAPSGNVSNNVWTHVAAVYDGSTMRIYKDGTQVGSTAKTGAIGSSGAAVWIGSNPPNAQSRPWKGSISDVRVYDKALSAQEVAGLLGGVNSPPSFSSSAKTTATKGQAYTYNIVAADPNSGDSLSILATTSPAWLNFVDNGGGKAKLSGTPGSTGSYPVVLQVVDQDGAQGQQSFTIGVSGGSTGGGGSGTGKDLLVMDINRPITQSDRGFPKEDPPRASANGNWNTPVNYAEGTFHVRAQVRSQPVAKDNYLQFCIWQYQFALETCMIGKKVRGTNGTVVTWSQSIDSMWKLNGKPIDWANPRQRYGMAIKNSKGQPVSSFKGWNWNGENPNQWYPLDMRFTVVVVPKGGTFSGWNNFIN